MHYHGLKSGVLIIQVLYFDGLNEILALFEFKSNLSLIAFKTTLYKLVINWCVVFLIDDGKLAIFSNQWDGINAKLAHS